MPRLLRQKANIEHTQGMRVELFGAAVVGRSWLVVLFDLLRRENGAARRALRMSQAPGSFLLVPLAWLLGVCAKNPCTK